MSPAAGASASGRSRARWQTGATVAALFAFGLLLRLLFQAATPDGGSGWHVGFQGDAPAWQDLAARIAQGIPDGELRLPWRPPGMMRTVAFLWDGEGATEWPVRLLFVVLGAAVAPLSWLLLRPHVAAPIALLTAVACAASSNLLLLSSGLHVETLYLFGVLLALLDQQRLARERALGAAVRTGLLHGLLCLVRAEHVVVVLVLLLVARANGARWRVLAVALLAAAAPLVPWQVHVHRAVAAFNAGAPPLPASAVPWEPAAIDALRALPSFQRVAVFRFVSATMRVRGRDRVRAADLEVVREAYGVYPEPIRPAFVALQGGLAFWLGWTPESNGGHSRAALDREPPLHGGDALFPPETRRARPRGGAFDFAYPPHLDAFVHGYRRGLEEIAADPAGALQRAGIKLWYAVIGATGGLGGHALPIGLSGVRPPVDLVVATGAWPAVWRVLVLGAGLWGLWLLRRTRALWPLLAFALVRCALLLLFFGHARHGALLLPVVWLGVAAALHAATVRRWPRLLTFLALALAAGLAALEVVRAGSTTAAVDGRPWLQPAGGVAQYQHQRVTFH